MKMSSVAEEMGPPADELIKGFLDYLVDPLLPLKSPRHTPPQSNQDKVAKQMHAVVFLYNHYQRKRHAQAEYLEFVSFCKLVVTLKPVLAAYMPSMQRSGHTDSEYSESQFSVTEKAIQEACTISMSLNVSKDIQDVNEWVVSKVAVFLVNSSKEKCALSFSSHTDGVWSIFEKSVDNCVENQENQAKSRNLNKRKRKRRQPTSEPDLQQLAFSALKEARGIERSHLTILEKHVTYSLDKERTAACCFIIECRSTIQEFEFSVRDIIESLQGPLAKKISGDWTLTQLIEFYNVLPYASIMSSWFSRQFPLLSSELLNASISDNYCRNDVPEYKKQDSKSVDTSLSESLDASMSENYCENDVPEYKKLNIKSVDNSLSDMVDVEGLAAENLEFRDNSISCDFTNAKVQEDASEKSYTRTQSKDDLTDFESEKTYEDDNLAKSKPTERRGEYDNGPEIEKVEIMDVNLGSKPSGSEALSQKSIEELMSVNVTESNKYSFKNANGQEDSCKKRSMPVQREVDRDVESDRTCDFENLHKSKSYERKSDDHNGSKREAVKGMDVNLSGTLPGAETLPKRSKDQPLDGNGIESKKSVLLFHKETNVESSSNDGDSKEAEQPSVKAIQPSMKEVDVVERTSTSSVEEEVSTFTNFVEPAKEVKYLLKSHDAAESSAETNPSVLYDRKVVQLELGGPHADDNQESSGTLTNEVNSTIISLLGDANVETELKSEKKLANEKDLKLSKYDSGCESNSDLLCGREGLQLKSGHIDEENILEEGSLPNEVSEISANIISQTNDVRSDKPDLDLSNQKNSKCGKMDSSLEKDVSVPIADSASSPLGKGSDSSVTCRKEKDKNLSTKAVIVYNSRRKRSRNQGACASTRCANTELETAKDVKSSNADCQEKKSTNRAIMPFNLCTPVADPAINPVESVHSTTNNLLSVLALKETELSQVALGVLLQKKRELCSQQQEIQDQITLCDQSIQKILDGDENSMVLKVDTIINCCNDFLNNKTEVQSNSYNQAGCYDAIQLPRPKKISKPYPFPRSDCQKLDNSDANICAPAGHFMSGSTGNFLAGVAAGEMDLKFSGEGASVLMEREPTAVDECRPSKRMVGQAPKTANN